MLLTAFNGTFSFSLISFLLIATSSRLKNALVYSVHMIIQIVRFNKTLHLTRFWFL